MDSVVKDRPAAGAIYYPNMDLVRYVLALAVLIAHYNELTGHGIPFIMSSFDAVGGFFAISGFLIFHGYERKRRLGRFVGSRARRILPPYFFIVILATVGLSAVSTLDAGDYFTSGGTIRYFLANVCFLNWLEPALPGVFDGPGYVTHAVNGALWTMKIEWCLYFSVPVVVWALRRFKWDKSRMFMAIIVLSIAYRLTFQYLYENTGSEIYNILGRQFFGQLAYFYLGALFYVHLDRLKSNLTWTFIICVPLYLLTDCIPYGRIFIPPFTLGLLLLGVSVISRTPRILRHGHNVSYNIYLFHYPVIQLSVFFGMSALSPWITFFPVLAVTVLLSIFSHYAVDMRFVRKSPK